MRTLAALLMLAALAAAQVDVSNVGYSEMTLVIHGSTPQKQAVYLPATEARQSTDYGNYPVERDEYGNYLAKVVGNYSFTFKVSVDGTKPTILQDDSFPVTKLEQANFLGDTTYIIASDSETKQRALDITRNSRSRLEAVRDLTLWTNKFITYDNKYWGAILSNVEALKERRGVCAEYTNLYAAMARSLNIPTRVATGMVFTGSIWQRHAWAESWVNGVWVPVDPTFGEVGMMNALHVKLYHAPDYFFYQFPQSLEDVEVAGVKELPFDAPLRIQARLSDAVVPPRGLFTLSANITNTGESILTPTYFAQKTVGIELLDDFRKTLVLHPGETAAVQWEFAAPFGERDTYFVILKGPGIEQQYKVEVNPALTGEGAPAFEILDLFSRVESGQLIVEFKVRNRSGNDTEARATLVSALGTVQQVVALRAGDEKLVAFALPAEPGSYNIEVRVEAGEARQNAFATAVVPESRQDLFSQLIAFLLTGSNAIFILLVIAALGVVVFTLLVPVQRGRKIAFREKDEWAKLLRMRGEK
jgi:hypothetical protein